MAIDQDPDIGPEDLQYAARPQDLKPFNELESLRDGAETYPAMLAAIAGAKRTVHLETYILRNDSVGDRFADALIERAKAGVTVRLLYDSFGSFSLADSFVTRLCDAGVKTREYNPVAPWRRRFRLMRRDHRKILVVDDEIAFTGGLNIGEDYASVDDGGRGWRDSHVAVRGPVVGDLARLFRKVWIQSDGDDYELPGGGATAAGDDSHVLAGVINNRQFNHRYRFLRAYLRAINSASASVDIMNAYFIPGLLVRRALKLAVKRGVVVRVIVPGVSDVKLVKYASGHLYGRLLRGGVRIFEWRDRMMHAKAAVVDGVWATIGSYNFDSQSLRQNLEVGVAAIDRPFAETLSADFDRDLANCHEVTLAELRRRPWTTRCLQWLAYRVRRFL